MTSDTAIIEQVVSTTVSVALRNLVMGVGGILYLFSLSPKLTAGILLGIPVIILPIVLLGRRLQNVSRPSPDRVADLGATTAEQMGALKIVPAYVRKSVVQRKGASDRVDLGCRQISTTNTWNERSIYKRAN